MPHYSNTLDQKGTALFLDVVKIKQNEELGTQIIILN